MNIDCNCLLVGCVAICTAAYTVMTLDTSPSYLIAVSAVSIFTTICMGAIDNPPH